MEKKLSNTELNRQYGNSVNAALIRIAKRYRKIQYHQLVERVQFDLDTRYQVKGKIPDEFIQSQVKELIKLDYLQASTSTENNRSLIDDDNLTITYIL